LTSCGPLVLISDSGALSGGPKGATIRFGRSWEGAGQGRRSAGVKQAGRRCTLILAGLRQSRQPAGPHRAKPRQERFPRCFAGKSLASICAFRGHARPVKGNGRADSGGVAVWRGAQLRPRGNHLCNGPYGEIFCVPPWLEAMRGAPIMSFQVNEPLSQFHPGRSRLIFQSEPQTSLIVRADAGQARP